MNTGKTCLVFLAIAIFCFAFPACSPNYYFQQKMADLSEIPVELINTSENKPMPMCGDGEIAVLLSRLICPDTTRVYKDIVDALSREDTNYIQPASSPGRIRKFKAYCYNKTYVMYLDHEACEDPRRFDTDWLKEPES